MPIRWKLLILLLVIALAPLALVSHLQRRATARLGTELARRIRSTLAADATVQLRQIVDDYGVMLGRDRATVELALQVQAREVDRQLATQPPRENLRVYFSRDFDLGGVAPPDLVLSPEHFTMPGGAEATPMPVTYSEQVFKLAPSVRLQDAAEDIARLANLLPTYQFLAKQHRDLFYWNYTSLESGVHSSYPGHGGYPAEYDPRLRPWYRQAVEANGLVWVGPIVDASSRRVLVTAAMPVHHPDGSIAGVTAIDVTLSDLLDRVKLPVAWSSQAKVLLVTLERDPATQVEAPTVLAQHDYGSRDWRWDTPIKPVPLESPDSKALSRMVADMRRRVSGAQEMSYKGLESLCVYGLSYDPGVYLVVVAPYDRIVEQAANAEEYVLGLTVRQLEVTGAALTAVVVLVIVAAYVAARTVTVPLRRLAHAATRLAGGDFRARAAVSGSDELAQMGRAFNDMVPRLEDNLRLRGSLALATQVQQNLLPAAAPRVEGLDVAGASISCDETSGDYYDFLDLSRISRASLGVAVGDVTGHGVAAALLMATARALLRSHAIQSGSLAEIFSDINAHMTADTPAGQFTTLFYTVIDAVRRTLRWVSAGHDPALLYTPQTDSFDELNGAGIPLGIEAAYAYQELVRDGLAPGQVIVIGTDGIWDTRNGEGRRFGKAALREVIRRHADRPAEEISRAISGSLADFRRGRPQEDDVTLVVVKVL